MVKSPLCLCVIYKFNHPSGAKILHLLETTKACGCNPAVTCFFFLANLVFFGLLFVCLFCRPTSRAPIFFEGSDFFLVALTPLLTTKPGTLISVGIWFFLRIEIFRLFYFLSVCLFVPAHFLLNSFVQKQSL